MKKSSQLTDEVLVNIAIYIKKTDSTVRQASAFFRIPKSTVYKYMVRDMKRVSEILAEELRQILLLHKKERASHGGKAMQNNKKAKKLMSA